MINSMSKKGAQQIGGRASVAYLVALRGTGVDACIPAPDVIVGTYCVLPRIWPITGRFHRAGCGIKAGTQS